MKYSSDHVHVPNFLHLPALYQEWRNKLKNWAFVLRVDLPWKTRIGIGSRMGMESQNCSCLLLAQSSNVWRIHIFEPHIKATEEE
jgi:hypothetical protein